MASKHVVDTRQLKKDIKQTQKKLTSVADAALAKVLAGKKQAYLEFDNVEAIPYSTLATGTVTFSGSPDDDFSLEAIVERETRELVDSTVKELNKGIKEVFK